MAEIPDNRTAIIVAVITGVFVILAAIIGPIVQYALKDNPADDSKHNQASTEQLTKKKPTEGAS